MAIKRSTKKKLITKHRLHNKDTGSPQVQIAILTKAISLLTKHLQEHKKDHSSRKGLLRKVSERRRLMKYLKREEPKSYDQLVEDLKL